MEKNDADIFLKQGVPINALMYADDLILISESKEGLQKQINKLSECCDKWKLEVNVKKIENYDVKTLLKQNSE